MMNTKTIPYHITPELWPLIDFRIKPTKNNVKNALAHRELNGGVRKEKQSPNSTNVEEFLNQARNTVYKVTYATLEPDKRFINRGTWLRNDDIHIKVHEKKRLYHKFPDGEASASWEIYKIANRKAKKAIIPTRVAH